jgi:hypothetical protein
MGVSFLLPNDIDSYIIRSMKTTQKAQRLLERMAEIGKMERGKVCPMKGRDHFNHQTWQAGRNVVRYVHRNDVPEIQRAIDSYNRFMDLVRKYADEIIRLSRREREKNATKRKSITSGGNQTDKKRI